MTPTGYGHHPSYAERMRLKIKKVGTYFLPQRLQLRAAHTRTHIDVGYASGIVCLYCGGRSSLGGGVKMIDDSSRGKLSTGVVIYTTTPGLRKVRKLYFYKADFVWLQSEPTAFKNNHIKEPATFA